MSKASSIKNDFKVIIVGGSYSGLTLAHCLDRANIPYIVLERRENSVLSSGYGTVIAPNGARILDQLGLYDDFLKFMAPIKYVDVFEDGKLLPRGLIYDGNMLFKPRHGYHGEAGDRKHFLNIMFDRLEDKSRILFGKNVTEISHQQDSVTVKCADGSSFEGDIVVAADGIRSKIRDVMREHIIKTGNEKVLVKDLKSMTSEYKSLYGVSDFTGTDDENLTSGHVIRMRTGRVGLFAFLGLKGQVFFFITWRMPEKYHKDNMPRFDEADIAEIVEPIRHWMITEKTTLGELIDRITSPLYLSPISEMNTEIWTWDRFVCCGDSVVKFMPQVGQGANQAMESAAALTNNLHKLLQSTSGAKPSLEALQTALRKYQNARVERAHAVGDYSGVITRLMEGATLKERLIDRYIGNVIAEVSANATTDLLIGCESLYFLPQPARVLASDRGFDYNYGGVGKKESKLKRAIYAIPLFFILIAATKAAPFRYMLTGEAATAWNNNFLNPFLISIPIGFKQLAFFVPVLSDYNPDAKLRAMLYASTLLPMLAVWWVESIRRANTFTFAEFAPLALGILAIGKGYSVAMPLLCALHYIQSPLHDLLFQDQRMVDIARVKTLLPALLLGYIVPTTLAFVPLLPHRARQLASAISIMHPVFLSVFSYFLSRFALDTTAHDRVHNATADLPYLRATYVVSGALPALVWILTLIRTPGQLVRMLFRGGETETEFFYVSAAGLVWVLLAIHDIKKGGRVKESWLVILTALAGGLIVGGPGALLVGAWAYREEALAKRLVRKSEITE